MARTYTDTERTDALALYVEHGLAEAHRRTDVPKQTIHRWAKEQGIDTAQVAGRSAEKTAAATETRLANMAARRADLAADLMDDVQRLRAQLFAPCVERKAMVVSHGQALGSEVEVVTIDHDQPPFREQQSIMTTLAIAVDKIQILTGEATERIEHRSVPERTPDQERELAKVLDIRKQAA